jgi:hypothetical protein
VNLVFHLLNAPKTEKAAQKKPAVFLSRFRQLNFKIVAEAFINDA